MSSHTSLGWGAVALLLLSHATAWAEGPEVTRLSPDRAVQLALSAHPTLHGAQAAVETARASRRASWLFLDNPQASAWTAVDGSRAELGIGQPLSPTGEGWAARRAARASTRAAEASLDRTRRELAAQVLSTYVQAAVAVGRLEVAQEGAELASRLSQAVGRLEEEGEASALERRLARLAQVEATARLLAARRAQAEALRELAGWVLRPVRAEELLDDPLEVVPPVPDQAVGVRADRRAAEEALEAARAQLRRAQAAAIGPWTVGLAADQEDGSTWIGPSLGLDLPLFDRNQVGRAQARGQLRVAEGRLAALDARIEVELSTSATRLDEAEAAVGEAGADRDRAHAALASIQAGVLAGEIDLPTAILLQSQVLDGEVAVLRLRGQVAQARIDRLLALDHPALTGGTP